MSVGHRHKQHHSQALVAETKRLLALPLVKAYLRRPYTVDYTRKIPLTGGSDVAGKKYFVDPDVAPKDRPDVLWHERTEKAFRDALKFDYPKAHKYATAAERILVESKGKKWEVYNARVEKKVRFNEKRGPERVPGLDPGPYQGSERKLLRRATGGRVFYQEGGEVEEPDPYAGTGMAQFRRAQGLQAPTGPIREGFLPAAGSMAQGVADLATTPQRAYKQGLSPEEEIAFGGNIAMQMMGLGTFGAPRGALGVAGSHPMPVPKEPAKPFYSAVERAVSEHPMEKAPADQWMGTIKNTPGIKAEELDWLGLQDWLKEQKGPVSKQDIADYVRANNVELKEVHRGELTPGSADKASPDYNNTAVSRYGKPYDALTDAQRADIDRSIGQPTKYGPDTHPSMSLPGGENYREMLLALPDKDPLMARARELAEAENGKGSWDRIGGGGQEHYIRDAHKEATKRLNSLMDDIEEYGAAHPNARASNDPRLAAMEKERDALMNRAAPDPKYKSSHWDEENPLAHVRFNDRVIDGKKTLFLEEIQSDWHQAGQKEGYKDPAAEKRAADFVDYAGNNLAKELRNKGVEEHYINNAKLNLEREVKSANDWTGDWESKVIGPDDNSLLNQIERMWGTPARQLADTYMHAYNQLNKLGTKGVPDAPFKTTWHELALKRMIRYAAEHGYDKIAWTPGKVQADRYNLSKYLDRVTVVPDAPKGEIFTWWPAKKGVEGGSAEIGSITTDANGKITRAHSVFPGAVGKNISEYLGKDLAKKGLEAQKETKFSGLDLEIGGEFHKTLYDKKLVQAADKIGKKHGAKVGEGTTHLGLSLGPEPHTQKVHTMDITPSLRKQAMEQGFPQFKRGGRIATHSGIRLKLSHSKVGYVGRSYRPTQHCAMCSMFRAPSSCTLVKSPIAAGGWCQRFSRK